MITSETVLTTQMTDYDSDAQLLHEHVLTLIIMWMPSIDLL